MKAFIIVYLIIIIAAIITQASRLYTGVFKAPTPSDTITGLVGNICFAMWAAYLLWG